MYRVDLTTDKYYQNIKSYEVSKIDPDYLTFHWGDGKYISIKKEYIISIHKK